MCRVGEAQSIASRPNLVALDQVHLDLERKVGFAVISAWQRAHFSQVDNEALALSLSEDFRVLNLGHEMCRVVDLENGSAHDCFLVCSDSFLTSSNFLKILRRRANAYEQASILVRVDDGDVELVSMQDDNHAVESGGESHLGEFSPDRMDHYVTRWQGRPSAFCRLGVGREAKTRRQLGFLSGLAVEHNRIYAAEGRAWWG